MPFHPRKATAFLTQKDEKVLEQVEVSRNLKKPFKYSEIRRNINSISSGPFGNVGVHIFGSRIIGLATNTSDLDIFIDIGGKYLSAYEASGEHDINYRKLVRALNNSADWIIQRKVLRTSVPIIEAIYKPLLMKCDFNITNGLGTENSKLLAHLFEIQPEAASMYHFIKLWMSAQGFEGLKGYTLCLLVLFYLQTEKLMPPIRMIQADIPKLFIGEWNVNFDPIRTLESYNIVRMKNYKSYIKGFFKFYKDFDYESLVMLPYPGITYKISKHITIYPKFYKKGIYIAGPVIRGKNCGIVDESVKQEFIKHCIDSFKFLKDFDHNLSPFHYTGYAVATSSIDRIEYDFDY